jgi:hypothetical protein
MAIRISEIEGSDKLRVDQVFKVFGKECPELYGYIEHDKDDWNTWYFYTNRPVLLNLEELDTISKVIRDKQNGIPSKAS